MPKSISKIGRPKTYRVPVLVRMDRKVLKLLDRWRKLAPITRAEAIRQIVDDFVRGNP
jgi:hypothetical protein